MRRILLSLFVLCALTVGMAWWWVERPMPMSAESIELEIESGMSPRAVAQAVARSGVEVDPRLLFAWFRFSGDARQIRAGNYEIPRGTSPRALLTRLVRGESSLLSLTIPEGWTVRQMREALARADGLRAETAGLADDALMVRLGRPGVAAEGRFFPDTYTYAKGSSDLAVLRRALHAMDRRLAAAWTQRSPQAVVRTPDEALILASIIEKETGRASDRPLIGGVFNNRLRIGMLLQTDPTVIYGMGDAFDGNLRKKDLQTDTPWNTYTRAGLPPTPIALPGRDSLMAAVQPAATRALYFVARGDGSSEFSETLEAHNRAVNRYQRGRATP